MIPLLRAAHVQPMLAVTALVTALAVSAGRSFGAGWVCLAILSGQLFIGWSNDWLDRDRDVLASWSSMANAPSMLRASSARCDVALPETHKARARSNANAGQVAAPSERAHDVVMHRDAAGHVADRQERFHRRRRLASWRAHGYA